MSKHVVKKRTRTVTKQPLVLIEPIGGGPVKFSKFMTDNDLVLVIQEASAKPSRWVAAFDEVVAAYMGMLVPVYGDGETPVKAQEAFRKKVAGHVLVKNPSSTFRQDIQAPSVFCEDMN